MGLLDDDEMDPQIVNVLEFYRSYGISDQAAFQLVLHILLTRTYAVEADAREAAHELGIDIPFIFPSNGTLH